MCLCVFGGGVCKALLQCLCITPSPPHPLLPVALARLLLTDLQLWGRSFLTETNKSSTHGGPVHPASPPDWSLCFPWHLSQSHTHSHCSVHPFKCNMSFPRREVCVRGEKEVEWAEFHQSCGQRKECGTLFLNHKSRWFGFHSFSGFITLLLALSVFL